MSQDGRAMAFLVGGAHDKQLHMLELNGAGNAPGWIEVGGRAYVMRDPNPLVYRAAS